ncbi:hypothetical protein IAU59_005254 [Kwoniella sp. CBS 9459]
MQYSDSRAATFEAILKPKSKAKPAFPLSPTTHPLLTPDALAQAGFYHTPGSSSTATDNCKCFLCGVELGGWDEEDDPFEEHARRGNCAWADMVCSVKLEKRKRDQSKGKYTTIYATAASLPQSAESASVREQTYKKWWPHKQKSGWLPTVKNLARAGFVYTPSTDSKDSVTCPYCEYGVEGWEATDDPWQVHHNKTPDCHFFRAQLESQESGPSESKTVSKASSRGKKSEVSKRSKRATTAAAAASFVSEGEDQAEPSIIPSDDEGSVAPSKTTTSKKRATKPRATTATTKAKSGGGRGKKKATTSEAEPEPEPEFEAAVQTEASEVEEEDHTIIVVDGPSDDEPMAMAESEGVVEVDEVSTKKGKSAKSKSSSTAKAKPRATTTTAKSKSKSTSRKKKVEDAAVGSQAEEEVAPALSEVESAVEVDDAEDEDAESEPETTPKPLAKSTSKSSKPSTKSMSTTSQSQKQSSSSRSTASSKPLPSLPPRSAPTSPSPVKQQPAAQNLHNGAWTSQLDRFTNIPPSSPLVPQTATPRSQATLRSNQPVKPSPHATLPRDALESSLNRGALEARKVLDDLMSSPQFNVGGSASTNGNGPVYSKMNGIEGDKAAKVSGRPLEEEEVFRPLTEEQKGMTLEDLVRVEMDDKFARMKAEGEEMIEQFLRRTIVERKKIEGL